MPWTGSRVPVLYLAPWVDIGGSDKGTIDWFRFLDRDRFRPSLITTQPSPNRRLREVIPYADEVWELPELMHGDAFARFIVTFVLTRGIRVVHVMNSRLGFDLLPDIASLPDRPAIVVQLHVEETDRSGYVRYATTRYGTLVDAFSVSSQALSDRLGFYHVPRAKRRLIRTGIDAEREYCPGRVRTVEGLDPGLFHILFPARLTAQKSPLLMVEVAAELRAAGLAFQIHVLGDGDLMPAVRERISAARLQDAVLLHGECLDVAPWYAGCDAVLLTSEYEGVPYVAYEAMAMATPIVAPELPGLAELLTPETGVLVSPREDARRYASAICALAADPQSRGRMGDAARTRARSEFSLQRMATEHGAVYEDLLARSARADPSPRPTDGALARNGLDPAEELRQLGAALRSRRPGATPLVSVIVPCFNHGGYLVACLRSIDEQDYDPIEVIVIDDGSTDPETLKTLARIERDGTATVLRLSRNVGPSAARNAAIERVRGRYVLPVDADNLLVPGAIAALVGQLTSAGERIGFIYPNCQYFGNRTDYEEFPSYNLYAQLASNYCDTSSLFDRAVFDRGFRYPEDIVLGHEDWDLVLSLAEHGIYGEAARAKTLLYRKHAFTRSDLVSVATVPFGEVVARRHPALFGAPRAPLKGEWNPAVTVIALDPLGEGSDDALRNLVDGAARQTCADFEVVVRTASEFGPTGLGRRLRRIPSALAASRAQALAHGLEISRGRYALATYGSPGALLSDPALIEKLLRILAVNPRIGALALGEGEPGPSPLRLLDTEGVKRAVLGALCWATSGATAPPRSLELAAHRPLETLAGRLSVQTTLQWRHLPRPDRRAVAAADAGPAARIGAARIARPRDARLKEAPAELPDCGADIASRLCRPQAWAPAQARLLCRHLNHGSGRYVFTNELDPPAGCSLQYVLGCPRALPLAGTIPLTVREEENELRFELGGPADLDAPELLGFVEQAPLPLFDALQVGRHRETGQSILIAGADDPLAGIVEHVGALGFIEAYPVNPRYPPHIDVLYGLVGLVRTVDRDARRHRYGAGKAPQGRLAGELGALLADPIGACEPLWIDDQGTVFADGLATHGERPSPGTALRWTCDPFLWRDFSEFGAKSRAAARRAYDAARILAAKPVASRPRPPDPAGYVWRSPTDQTVPLYASIHPATGDQLLSTDEREPRSMGYADDVLLGHLVARAPVTGTLGTVRLAVPWATRFGAVLVGES